MKKFLLLYVDELNRSKTYFLGIVAFMLVSEGASLFYKIFRDLSLWREGKEVVPSNIMIYMVSGMNNAIHGGIFLALAIFSFLIWQRDWQGKGRMIYRLMTLPGSRLSVGLAKWATVMTFIFALLGIQLALIAGCNVLLAGVLPKEIYTYLPYFYYFSQQAGILNLFLPFNGYDFLMSYLLGSSLVLVLFNAVVLYYCERVNGLLRLVVKESLFFIGIVAFIFNYWRGMFVYLHPLELEIAYLSALGSVILIGINLLLLNYQLNRRLYC